MLGPLIPQYLFKSNNLHTHVYEYYSNVNFYWIHETNLKFSFGGEKEKHTLKNPAEEKQKNLII